MSEEDKKNQKNNIKNVSDVKKLDNVEIVNKDESNENFIKKDEKNDLEKNLQNIAVKGKKKKKIAPFFRGGRGQVHIKSSYNNTIISITDLNGAVLIWSSAGKCGFKGPRKATPYAAGVIVKSMIDKIKSFGIKELDVFVKGVGSGRESAIRAFDSNRIKIVSIKDVSPIPHGGCRPKKKRRV